MPIAKNTELRHLTSVEIIRLSQILDQMEAWKKLMRIIPKNLSSLMDGGVSDNLVDAAAAGVNNHPLPISGTNQHSNHHTLGLEKYNNNHIRLIENASNKQNKFATEILFEEWGTSGRVRPTLNHLFQLLVKAELFRAADYISVDLFGEKPAERPSSGPAAKINIDLPLDEDEQHIANMLNEISYPKSSDLINDVHSLMNNNKDFYSKYILNDEKKLQIDENHSTSTTSSKAASDLIKFSTTSITVHKPMDTNQNRLSIKPPISDEMSDLIKFSTISHPVNINGISDTAANKIIDNLNHSTHSEHKPSQSHFSNNYNNIIINNNSNSKNNINNSNLLPELSELLQKTHLENISESSLNSELSNYEESDDLEISQNNNNNNNNNNNINIVNLSMLMSSTSNITNSNNTGNNSTVNNNQSDYILPNISLLQNNNDTLMSNTSSSIAMDSITVNKFIRSGAPSPESRRHISMLQSNVSTSVDPSSSSVSTHSSETNSKSININDNNNNHQSIRHDLDDDTNSMMIPNLSMIHGKSNEISKSEIDNIPFLSMLK